MQRKLPALLGLLAAAAGVSTAQNNHDNVKLNIALGQAQARLIDSRPRIAPARSAAVKSSVVINTTSIERLAFNALNEKRAELGLKPLAWNDQLAGVARLHSQNMASQDFFSHKGINGDYVSDRADSLNLGVWRAIGENIAFNRGYDDPVMQAVESWIDSPSHRRNLMNQDWRESAVGVAVRADGSYYFTQVFLTRK